MSEGMPDKMPVSVAFKLLIKERDYYKEQAKKLEDEIKALRKENMALVHDYKESNWYKQRETRIRRLELENRDLWKQLSKSYNYETD